MNDVRTNAQAGTRHGRSTVVLIFFLIFAAYFLWTEHRAHTIQYLPYAILLLCPFMHFFMHGSHGQRGGDADDVHAIRTHSDPGDPH